MINLLKNNVRCQGHLKVNVAMLLVKGHDLRYTVCEYEVNRLTNEKVITGKRDVNANCLRRRPPNRPDGFTNLLLSIKGYLLNTKCDICV